MQVGSKDLRKLLLNPPIYDGLKVNWFSAECLPSEEHRNCQVLRSALATIIDKMKLTHDD